MPADRRSPSPEVDHGEVLAEREYDAALREVAMSHCRRSVDEYQRSRTIASTLQSLRVAIGAIAVTAILLWRPIPGIWPVSAAAMVLAAAATPATARYLFLAQRLSRLGPANP